MKIMRMQGLHLLILLSLCFSAANAAKKPDLCGAIKAQDIEAVKMAVEAGADIHVNCAAFPAIVLASYKSNSDIIRYLVSKGAKVDDMCFEKTALYFLIDERKAYEPDTLLQQNKAYNARVITNCKGDVALAQKKNWLMHEDINRWDPVINRMKTLLDLGADPNISIVSGKTTPFLRAVELRDLEAIKLMLSTGKVNLELRFNAWLENVVSRTYSLNRFTYDKDDWKTIANWEELPGNNTPLMHAVEQNDLELVKLLVEAGAYVNAVKKVRTIDKEFDLFVTTQTKTLTYFLLSVYDLALAKKNTEIQKYLEAKGAVSMVKK